MADKRLTPKLHKFLEHYVANGGIGKAAAMAVGVDEKVAATMASQWLARDHVAAELARSRKVVSDRTEFTLEAAIAVTERRLELALADKAHGPAAMYNAQIMKMAGHLNDRLQIDIKDPPSITAALEAARSRIIDVISVVRESEDEDQKTLAAPIPRPEDDIFGD